MRCNKRERARASHYSDVQRQHLKSNAESPLQRRGSHTCAGTDRSGEAFFEPLFFWENISHDALGHVYKS